MLRRLRRLGTGQASLLDHRAATHLHVMASSVGYDIRRGPGYDWHGLRRGQTPFGLLQYTLRGEGRLRWEGREFRPGPGQAMLLEIPHEHRYWLPRHGEWEFCWAVISGAEALRLWREIVRDLGPVVDLPGDGEVARLIEDLIATGLCEAPQAYGVSARVYALLMALLAQRDRRRLGSDCPPAIRNALELGERRFAEAIGVDDLARAAGLSRYHFSRLFRRHLGTSPGLWLQRLRCSRAAGLLGAGELGLTEIAGRCGFADANYLGKVFRRAYGISPGAFRRKGLG